MEMFYQLLQGIFGKRFLESLRLQKEMAYLVKC